MAPTQSIHVIIKPIVNSTKMIQHLRIILFFKLGGNRCGHFPLAPKLKHFLWRACHDILPTSHNLFKRKALPSPCCCRCLCHDETLEHALFRCPTVQERLSLLSVFGVEALAMQEQLVTCWSAYISFPSAGLGSRLHISVSKLQYQLFLY
ncbi:uncharacterized protein LOC133037644 isoform X2 [Cannabis sativa]|uniref:uncharacterized protein LOC133037644 isoform X2 n=1 Tax=Cannabis sativa TaxID=3483 RepID=UPI0029CA2F26|nr:uncharacterized protein LOC133037644 isoform X2 [Cannabis sativa]